MSDQASPTWTAATRGWRRPVVIATVLLLAGGVVTDARADTPTAATLQEELRSWFAHLTGAEKGPPPALTVTRDGDSYRILIPIPGLVSAVSGQPAGLVTSMHPLDGGRWSIDGMTLPSPSNITITPPPGGLKDAGLGLMRLRIGTQTAAGVFDPTYATPSTLDANLANVHTETAGDDLRQTQDYHNYKLHIGLVPHPSAAALPTNTPRMLDAAESATIAGMHLASDGKAKFDATADDFHLAGIAIGADPDRVGAMFAATFRFAASVLSAKAATPGGAAKPPIDRTTLREVVAGLTNLADKIDISESIDNLRVVAGGATISLGHAALGMGGTSHAGLLSTYLDLGIDHLDVSDAPPSMRPYLPRHVHLHPTIGGIGAAEAIALMNAALAPDSKSDLMGAAVLGLFAHGGIKVGIDDLAIDLGDSSLTGTGSINVPAPVPAVITGKAKVIAHNLDALIGHMQADPQATQAVEALMMAKALGRTDGDATIWDVTYRGGTVMVNGHALMPPSDSGSGGGDPGGPMKDR